MAENRQPKQVTIDGITYYVDEKNNYYIVRGGSRQQISSPTANIVEALKYSDIFMYDTTKIGKMYPDVVVRFRREKPPRALPTTVNVPERGERLEMPLLGEAVNEEVKRLTLDLIGDPSELLNADLNFRSINSVPEYEIGRSDDEESFGIYFEEEYTVDDKPVIPQEVEEDMEGVFRIMSRWVAAKNTSFSEYADNFTVEYDQATGAPKITATVPVNSGIIDQVGIRAIGRISGEGAKDQNGS